MIEFEISAEDAADDSSPRFRTPGYFFEPRPETLRERTRRIRQDDAIRLQQLKWLVGV